MYCVNAHSVGTIFFPVSRHSAGRPRRPESGLGLWAAKEKKPQGPTKATLSLHRAIVHTECGIRIREPSGLVLNICVGRRSGTVPGCLLARTTTTGIEGACRGVRTPDVWGVGNQGPFLRTSSRMWKLSPSQRPGPATTYHRAGKSRRWRAALLSGSRAHATPRRLPGLLSCAAWSVLWPLSCRFLDEQAAEAL